LSCPTATIRIRVCVQGSPPLTRHSHSPELWQ
jgi:hypothetical protein